MQTNLNTFEKEYRVYAPRLEALKHQIGLLNKRAAKLGVPAITVEDTGRFEDVQIRKPHPMEHEVQRVDRFVFVKVVGTAPKFEGWSLAAVVEHTEEGNILRKSPDCTVELNQFRTGAPRCDHCRTIRNRRDTFICLHENGQTKVVGSNCIKDFLGHNDPHMLARLAELSYSLRECCESAEEGFDGGGCGHDTRIHLETALSYAALVIRHKGFVSGKKARESQEVGGNLSSTAMHMGFWMNPGRYAVLGKDYFRPEESDHERGQVARQFVIDTLGAKDPEALNDFEHNLLLLCRCESVEQRNMGLIAFVPEYYARQTEQKKREENAAAASSHFGELSKRYRNVVLTYIRSAGYTSQFGDGFFHTLLTEDGAKLSWKTTTPLEYDVNAKFTATFTVKRHSDFRGEKQTEISRLVEEPAAVEAVHA